VPLPRQPFTPASLIDLGEGHPEVFSPVLLSYCGEVQHVVVARISGPKNKSGIRPDNVPAKFEFCLEVPVGYTGQLFAAKDRSIWLLDSYVPGDQPGEIGRWTQEDGKGGRLPPFVPHVRKPWDRGKRWSEPESLTIQNIPELSFKRAGLALYVPPRELQDGTLMLPLMMAAQKPDPLVIQPLLLRSSDQGRTWQASLIDPNHTDASETDLIELAPNHLLAFMRTNFYTGFNWESRSYDGGKTWFPIKLGELPGWSSGPRLLKTRGGVLVCMHRFLGTTISLSLDLGKTWQTFQVDTPIEVMGDLLELADGRILAVYSAGGWAGIPRLQYLWVTRNGIEVGD
jgi:hypothetical protein